MCKIQRPLQQDNQCRHGRQQVKSSAKQSCQKAHGKHNIGTHHGYAHSGHRPITVHESGTQYYVNCIGHSYPTKKLVTAHAEHRQMQAADGKYMYDPVGLVQFPDLCIQHPLFSQEHGLHHRSVFFVVTGIQQQRQILPDPVHDFPEAIISTALYKQSALHDPALPAHDLIVIRRIEFSRIRGMQKGPVAPVHHNKTAHFWQCILPHIA